VQVIQGVEATVLVGPQAFRLVVLAEALIARFGLDKSPESWLRACADHAAEIERAACEQFRAHGDPLVILRDFGEAATAPDPAPAVRVRP